MNCFDPINPPGAHRSEGGTSGYKSWSLRRPSTAFTNPKHNPTNQPSSIRMRFDYLLSAFAVLAIISADNSGSEEHTKSLSEGGNKNGTVSATGYASVVPSGSKTGSGSKGGPSATSSSRSAPSTGTAYNVPI